MSCERTIGPQETALEAVKAAIGGYISDHVKVCPKDGRIEFKLHTGGKIKDIGSNGCHLSEIIKVVHLIQTYYQEKYGSEKKECRFNNHSIAGLLGLALEQRMEHERNALVRMFEKDPYKENKS